MSENREKTEALLGGTKIQVVCTQGEKETINIRQLAVREMPQMLAALEDENRLVELFAGKPEGWSDTLTVESFEKVVTEGERVNVDFFSRWVQRRLNRQEKLMPGITEQLARNAGLPLPTLSQKPPSAAA